MTFAAQALVLHATNSQPGGNILRLGAPMHAVKGVEMVGEFPPLRHGRMALRAVIGAQHLRRIHARPTIVSLGDLQHPRKHREDKSVSENYVESCGEGFWLWPRRRGRSIPK